MFGLPSLNIVRSLPGIVNKVITRSFRYDRHTRVTSGINQRSQYFKPGEEDIYNMPDEETRVWKEQRSLFKIDKRGPLPRQKKKCPLDNRPQLRGIVLKTVIKKPKKPNSANRKCVYVRLSNGKEATCYVPGIGHNLQEHSNVLVKNHPVSDVPGLKLRVIRGVYDCSPIIKGAKK